MKKSDRSGCVNISPGRRPCRWSRACDSLQQTISRLYRQAGIKHGSSHSGRRSLAAKVLAVTGDVEIVQTILGHACLDHSKPYLAVDMQSVRRAFELALA